ncbi:MAG: excinuclease subunit protein, putative endonuclease [Candidatus Levybacteria bacterium]|nr:excinuclease subunit protein, putative endonuclease [Candidatus Levybacteria bacterium]
MKFYYVYILHNFAKKFIYIGFSEDLKTRVASHNKGENKSTKSYGPLELIHYEAYRNMKDAKRRELYLKSNKGRTTLITMLKEYFEGNPKRKSRIPSSTILLSAS